MSKQSPSAEQIVLEVMRHFGFRRNYQVAEYFDVMPQTLSGWIKTGEIPAKHLMKYNEEVLSQQNQENIESFPISHSFHSQASNEKLHITTKISFLKIKLVRISR